MSKPTANVQPVATVPLPSADLLQYFMKETKENFEKLGKQNATQFKSLDDKLERAIGSFLTKEEAAALKAEHEKDIADLKEAHAKDMSDVNKKFDDQRWYWRALITAVLLALASEGIRLIAGFVHNG